MNITTVAMGWGRRSGRAHEPEQDARDLPLQKQGLLARGMAVASSDLRECSNFLANVFEHVLKGLARLRDVDARPSGDLPLDLDAQLCRHALHLGDDDRQLPGKV